MASDDIANLGIAVHTGGLTKGEKALNKYAATGEKTERRMGNSVNSMNKDFMSLKSSIGLVAVSLAALKISNDVIKSHIAFGSAISQLSAITGAVGKDLEFYKEQSIAIGASTTLSATQAANAFKLIASAKPDLLSSSEALASVTKEAVTLAEAASIDLPQAAQALGSSLNQFQLPASEASNVINVLAASSKQGTASIVQISESLVNAGSASNSLGISLPDTVSGLQALAKAGIIGSDAGTALRQVMLKMEKTADTGLMPSINGLVGSIEGLASKQYNSTQLMKIFGEEGYKAATAILAQRDTLEKLSKSLIGTSTAYEQARINNDNLGGDLKKLTSVIETLSLAAGSNLDGSLRGLTQTATDLLSNIGALTNAGEAFISVVGVGIATSIAKVTAATVSQIASDMSAITASRATGIARATMAESYAASAAVMAAAEVEESTAKAAGIKYSIAALEAEVALNTSRIASAATTAERIALTTALAETQTAKLALTNMLTVAELELATAEVAATETTIAQSAAVGGLARAEGVATASTTALGAAITFLTGGWGLLIAAIGVAATVFITTGDDSDTLTSFLKEQDKTVGDLEGSYKRLSKAQIGSAYVEAQKLMISYESERLALTSKLNESSGKKDRGSIQRTKNLSVQLLKLDKSMKAPQKRMTAINDLMQSGFDSMNWVDPVAKAAAKAAKLKKDELIANAKVLKSYDDTMDALDLLSKQQTLSANEYELHAAKMKAIDKGMSAGQITAIQNRIREIQKERSAIKGATEYQDWVDKITSSTNIGKLQALQDELIEVYMAMDGGDIPKNIAEEKIKSISDQIKSIGKKAGNPFEQMIKGAKEAGSAMSGLFENGSKEAKEMAVAMAALNLIAGVGAILTQGKGEPYSAFGRMAAMATMVASLGVAVGSLGGGLVDDSKQNQADQGLNVWGEKSESISKSIDMTASATDKLVGINTGMLKALQNMQAGIAAATGLSARGAKAADFTYKPDVDTNPLSGLTGIVKGNFIDTMSLGLFSGAFKAIGKLFGGSSKVTDSGIKILGGTLSSMIEGASVFAFQDVKSKKHRWSHTKRHEELQALDDASKQFALVFDSLADSVYEGATALGLSGDEVTNAINKFQIETTKISLKGLDIDEQQKEIEAVFSKVFNDLAGFVTIEVDSVNGAFRGATDDPKSWLEDFRKTGEELGETLARLAGEVTTADWAVKNLGIELGDKLANPKLYAEIADNLSTLTGGIESFAEKTSSFVDNFAPESEKLRINGDALTKALTDVGLKVPTTTDGFYSLMQSLDGTTSAGQKQIAAMLNSQDVAKEYFKLLKDGDSELNSFNKSLMSLSNSLTSAVKSIYGISSASASASLDAAISAARIGDFSKALNLDVSSFKLDQSSFSSLADFNFAQAEVANRMTELADLTGSQASVEDMMLTESQKQTELLTSINSNYVPQKTASDNNVIMLEEIKALRSEISRGNDMQQESTQHAKDSADHLETLTVFGVEVRK